MIEPWPELKISMGNGALVTGASAGIGVALARELGSLGAKLILTARRADRLEALATELRAKGTEVRIVLADLTDPDAPTAIFDAVGRENGGGGLEVDILINNAGLGLYGDFYKSDFEQELSQVRVNCEAMVHLTRLFVPAMVERRRGWVLVVASTASFQPCRSYRLTRRPRRLTAFLRWGWQKRLRLTE